MLQKATTKNTFFIKEVGQKAAMCDVMTVRFCPSSINKPLIIQENPLLKSFPELPPIRFIRVLNIDKDKPVKDQLKVIREDVLYMSNKIYQVLQVIERFNQWLFNIENQLKVVEEGLKKAKKDTAVKV